MARVVLASRSPRRLELLRRIGVEPVVVPADIDETPRPGESPVDYVVRVAREKARAVAGRGQESRVLAADTTIDLDGMILGQPVDAADEHRMLGLLSGRTHRVHTAVALVSDRGEEHRVVTSLVTFQPLADSLREWYVGTGEWQGKAGGYAVQGLGSSLVASVRGSMSNVIGLPLRETAEILGNSGWTAV